MATTSKNTKTVKNPTTPKKVDYTFNSKKESASQYNQRIAQARGDTAGELKSMQNATTSEYKSKGLNPNTVINSITTQPNTPIVLPTPAPVQGMTNTTNANNANLAGLSGSTYDAKTGQIVSSSNTSSNPNQLLIDQVNTMMSDNASLPSQESLFKKSQKTFKPQQQLVNSLQNQLNSITTRRDAQNLSLEGQGRGQTDAFLGGEQARISREAAIQALPIQAQLAAAQDDLDSARTYASQLFQAQSQDAQARYNFQKEVHSTIFSYLNEQEKRALAVKDKEADRAFQLQRDNRSMIENLINKAMEYGQSSKLAEIMGLNPDSPTFMQDYAQKAISIQKPVSGGSDKRDTAFDKDGNLVDMQTGEVITQAGGASAGGGKAQQIQDQLSLLRTTASDATTLAGSGGILNTPVGPSGITRFIGDTLVGNTSFRQLQNLTDTLKTNMLTIATDPDIKKFFGPQMSNTDIKQMLSAGSTLDPQSQNPDDYIKEVQRLDEIFNRLQTSAKSGNNTLGIVLTGADGLQYTITD